MQTNGAVRPIVRKKAALCLLRLLRKAGPDSDMLAPDVWSVKLVSCTVPQHTCFGRPDRCYCLCSLNTKAISSSIWMS